MRLRSVVAVAPGGPPLAEILGSAADALLFTLADARTPVDDARQAAIDGVRATHAAGKVALVFANHPRTGLLEGDLEAMVSASLAGVMLSTRNPQDVRDATVALRRLELERGVEPGHVALFPVIDTARGLLRAGDIVDAAPRVAGLAFNPEAYAFDVGGRPEESGPRFAYARGLVVAVSRASDREPLVFSSGLELRFLAQHGFAGAIIEELRYVPVANQVFLPNASAMKRAQRHMDAFAAGRAEGSLAARVESEIADQHSVRKARQALGLTAPPPQD